MALAIISVVTSWLALRAAAQYFHLMNRGSKARETACRCQLNVFAQVLSIKIYSPQLLRGGKKTSSLCRVEKVCARQERRAVSGLGRKRECDEIQVNSSVHLSAMRRALLLSLGLSQADSRVASRIAVAFQIAAFLYSSPVISPPADSQAMCLPLETRECTLRTYIRRTRAVRR